MSRVMDPTTAKSERRWINDDESSCCMLCRAPFGAFTRRHHCRACGQLCCGPCSSAKLELEEILLQTGSEPGKPGATYRVCDTCKEERLAATPVGASDAARTERLARLVGDDIQPANHGKEQPDDGTRPAEPEPQPDDGTRPAEPEPQPDEYEPVVPSETIAHASGIRNDATICSKWVRGDPSSCPFGAKCKSVHLLSDALVEDLSQLVRKAPKQQLHAGTGVSLLNQRIPGAKDELKAAGGMKRIFSSSSGRLNYVQNYSGGAICLSRPGLMQGEPSGDEPTRDDAAGAITAVRPRPSSHKGNFVKCVHGSRCKYGDKCSFAHSEEELAAWNDTTSYHHHLERASSTSSVASMGTPVLEPGATDASPRVDGPKAGTAAVHRKQPSKTVRTIVAEHFPGLKSNQSHVGLIISAEWNKRHTTSPPREGKEYVYKQSDVIDWILPALWYDSDFLTSCCRFGMGCTRVECYFDHPAGWSARAAKVPCIETTVFLDPKDVTKCIGPHGSVIKKLCFFAGVAAHVNHAGDMRGEWHKANGRASAVIRGPPAAVARFRDLMMSKIEESSLRKAGKWTVAMQVEQDDLIRRPLEQPEERAELMALPKAELLRLVDQAGATTEQLNDVLGCEDEAMLEACVNLLLHLKCQAQEPEVELSEEQEELGSTKPELDPSAQAAVCVNWVRGDPSSCPFGAKCKSVHLLSDALVEDLSQLVRKAPKQQLHAGKGVSMLNQRIPGAKDELKAAGGMKRIFSSSSGRLNYVQDDAAGAICLSRPGLMQGEPSSDRPESDTEYTIREHEDALSMAIKLGDLNAVQQIVRKSKDVNATLPGDLPMVCSAARIGHLAVLQYLVSEKVDVRAVEPSSQVTALMHAASQGHKECVQLLLQTDAQADIHNVAAKGGTALIQATWNGHRECVVELLRANADPQRTTQLGSALIKARQQHGPESDIYMLLQQAAQDRPARHEAIYDCVKVPDWKAPGSVQLFPYKRFVEVRENRQVGEGSWSVLSWDSTLRHGSISMDWGGDWPTDVLETTDGGQSFFYKKTTAAFGVTGERYCLLELRGQLLPSWLFPDQPERSVAQQPSTEFVALRAELSQTEKLDRNWPQRWQNCASLIIDNRVDDLCRYFQEAGTAKCRKVVNMCEEPIDGKLGRTLLMVAAEQGAAECIDLIIDARAVVDRVDAIDKLSALDRASAKGWGNCVDILIAKGATHRTRAARLARDNDFLELADALEDESILRPGLASEQDADEMRRLQHASTNEAKRLITARFLRSLLKDASSHSPSDRLVQRANESVEALRASGVQPDIHVYETWMQIQNDVQGAKNVYDSLFASGLPQSMFAKTFQHFVALQLTSSERAHGAERVAQMVRKQVTDAKSGSFYPTCQTFDIIIAALPPEHRQEFQNYRDLYSAPHANMGFSSDLRISSSSSDSESSDSALSEVSHRKKSDTTVGKPSVDAPQLRAPCINVPGAWNFMISYTQRSPVSETLANKIHGELVKRGFAVWLDVTMPKRDEAAMQEGVKNAACVIAIVSGPVGDDKDSAYFRRPFCLQELYWAQEDNIPVVPVVSMEDKGKITEFFEDIPVDLDHMRRVNWEHIDRKDVDYFNLGIDKILRAATDAAKQLPTPASEPALLA